MTMRRRLLTGGISNFVARFTTAAVWFVLTPFVLAHVEPSGYALWVLMGAVASYGYLLDFGVGSAVVKYVAEHTARGERDPARTLITTARVLAVALAVLTALLALAVAHILPALLTAPAAQQQLAIRLVLLTGIDVAIAIAYIPHVSVLRGLQRYDLANGVAIAASLVQGVATVGVLLAGWGVLGMIAINIPTTIASGLAFSAMARRVAPDLMAGSHVMTWTAIRRITSFSTSGFAIDMAARLQTKTDEWVIALFMPVTAVTPYALARRLGEVTALAAVQCLKVVMPVASELDAGKDAEKLGHLYITGSRLALAFAAPVTAVLMVIGGPVLALWVGPQYGNEGALVAVLAAASLLATSQAPATQVLLGIARHRVVAISAVSSGIANVLLSILLLQWFGLLGVAFGTLIPTAVTSLAVTIPFANRTLGVSTSKAIRKIWVPGLLPAVAAAGVLWLFRTYWLTPLLAEVATAVAVATCVYGLAYLAMPACAAERGLVADVVADISERLKRQRLAPAAESVTE
jgi:O-antigen/teichoic acid export membrane protein